ncbi:MAG: thioredoxin domain-containing protein [Candidatus Omnitrophica bacterium]|nr:thioredoxin domain-containing protein [Candidatus Omnitrophota bacterium]HOX54667.1 thioredoxin domain-containing protein [Candidatus Omnitrophota bacterium]
MKEKLFIIAILLATVSIAINSFITARNTQTLFLKPQIQEIMLKQTLIEKQLATMEITLNKLQATFDFLDKMKPPPAEDFSKFYNIDLGRSFVKGNKNAKVTIVEFSDFQCPFSKRFHAVIEDVLKAFPNDVKFVFKNFPLAMHQQARSAAKASLAAGLQGKYWEMVDLLFKNSPDFSEEKYKEWAGQLGLNVEKFMQDYKEKDAEWEKLIKDDMALADSVDVRGTPTFFVNGLKTMARDLASFKGQIDLILKGGAK